MADDISKKITIGVEMETDKLTQNITSLHKAIDSLATKQKQLTAAGKQNSAAFAGITLKLDALQKKLHDATAQVTANTAALDTLSAASKTASGAISSLTTEHQKNTKATSDGSSKVKELSGELNSLGAANKAAEGSLSALATQHQQNTKAIGDSAAQAKELIGQLISLGGANKTAEGLVSSLTTQHKNNAKAATDNTGKAKALTGQLTSLGKAVKQQSSDAGQGKSALDAYAESTAKGTINTQQLQGTANKTSTVLGQQVTVVSNSKKAFDNHKTTLDHLKKSFDEIKNVSGIFGPSLKEAADGFNAMKTGLTMVQGGLTGIGEAIKADGFGFLLEILQYIFDFLTKTTTGSNILKGAISAIGVVVNTVSGFFHSLMDGIINAFSHPIDTLKTLGKIIETNIINRFKGFSMILDGIIHLDFKKMASGAVQAFTGVTNATDKVGKAITTVKKGVEDTAKQMATAYKKGYEKAGKQVDKHDAKVKASVEQQKGYYDELQKKIKEANAAKDDNKNDLNNSGTQDQTVCPPENPDINDCNCDKTDSNSSTKTTTTDNGAVAQAQATENTILDIKKTALQKFEDYAKQNGVKMATDALNTLNASIKHQSGAKVAALEKDKAAELRNANLTSAQKLAIQQKYKQQEGQIKAKAFKEEQELSIAQALINGAVAVTKVSAQAGLLGAVEVGVVIAETAAQVAKIASQKPPAYATGGLHYSSDGRGGVLPGYSRSDNTNAYLRSGEGIVVSEAMQAPWARNLVSAINVGFGGRDFSMANPGRGYAVGGIFTDGGDANRYYNQPVTDQKNLANTIAYQMINNFPPVYVDVKDVNNQQNILAQTINRVNL